MVPKVAQKKRILETYNWFFDESVFVYFALLEIAQTFFFNTIFPFDVIQLILSDYLEVQHRFTPKVGLTVQCSIVQTYQGFYVFGCNGFGQHAVGDAANYEEPHKSICINELLQANNMCINFDCGGDHILLQTNDGLYSWGYNGSGQLGLGTYDDEFRPQRVPVPPAIMFACGGDHSLVITEQGIFTFGMNSSGQLGLQDTFPRYEPCLVDLTTISGLSSHLDILSVACCYNTSVLLTVDSLFVTGCNRQGQLGIGDIDDCNSFTKMNSREVFVSIACGGHHMMGLTEKGELWGWGRNEEGQLGTGAVIDSYYPVRVSMRNLEGDMLSLLRVSCGGYHTIAQCKNGDIYGWGDNQKGQLALDSGHQVCLPEKIEFKVIDEPINNYADNTTSHHEVPILENDNDNNDNDNNDNDNNDDNNDNNDDDSDSDTYAALKKFEDFYRDKKTINVVPFQIICGRNFTIVLSKTGIYSVGENNHRQLGWNKTIDDTNVLNKVKECPVSPPRSTCSSIDQLIQPFNQLAL